MPSSNSEASTPNPEDSGPVRRRGRPKGSKNGPNAGSVGRPRKDGQPPKKRNGLEPRDVPSKNVASVCNVSLPPAEESAQPQADAQRVGELSLAVTRVEVPGTLPASVTAISAPTGSHIANPVAAINDEEATRSVEASGCGLVGRKDIDVVVDGPGKKGAYTLPWIRNLWAPSKGPTVQNSYGGYGDDEDPEDMDMDDSLDVPNDSSSSRLDEFQPIPDDDERTSGTPEVSGHGAESTAADTEQTHSKERATLPLWLSTDYADARERLVSEMSKNPSRRPTCYDRGTFIDHSSPFFTTSTKLQVRPEHFYKPTYFVFIPHVIVGRIPCPRCLNLRKTAAGKTVYLTPNGWPKSPRRVIDLDQCIYIIGYRYYCPHPECKSTYLSWSPSLLKALPRNFAMEFTHHLTFRSGLTDRVVALMRACFLQGIGPGPFANIIHTNHIRRYEQLHLQYLEMVYLRQHLPLAFTGRYEPFSSFDDRDGYAGFSPSPRYFRDFYINHITSHSEEMDQYTALLSAKCLQIDHSFKVPKHLGKLNGVPVFTALHTAVNEFGEIRSMVMTPTKAHDQFMPALQSISTSLETYGHGPIEIVFTDSPRIDKGELEAKIPSLSKDITPVPNVSTLAELLIPSDIPVLILSSTYQVNTRLTSIMQSIKDGDEFYAAVDMEWSVNRADGISGHVALISLTYGHEIFLIPLSSYLKDGFLHLPHALLTFLYAPQIYKVGVRVSADLTRLFHDCGYTDKDKPFAGAAELGKLAKETGAASTAGVGLADLCASVLRQFLPKDETVRISTAWDLLELPKKHIEYAACDVYATWAVFKALSTISGGALVGNMVNATTAGGTPVSLFSSDNSRVVAEGIIALDRPTRFNGVNVTKTRVLVTISNVLIPGYLVPRDLLPIEQGSLPLSTFSEPPFHLLCKAKHVRIRAAGVSVSRNSKVQTTTTSESNFLPSSSMTMARSPVRCEHPAPNVVSETSYPTSLLNQVLDGNTWYEDAGNISSIDEQRLAESIRDDHGHAMAVELSQISERPPVEGELLRSRVLGDIWHLMHQFPISMAHGLRRPFARALRDAFFEYDPEDKAALEAFLESRGVSWDYALRYHSTWLLRRVRRLVPKAEALLPRITRVLYDFGPMLCAKSHQPLFNPAAWDVSKNVLENIRCGLYSDPPSIPLYYVMGKDKHGLLRYRCIRGTNAIEGGVHQNVIRWFGAFSAAPNFALQLLRDYSLYHNLKVGTPNRTGKKYNGSYDIWTRNQISHLTDILSTQLTKLPEDYGPGGWINGNQYVQTTEVFGILPMPTRTREQLGMLEFHADFAKRKGTKHMYLARQQKTRVAVLPIHTKAERGLFRLLVSDSQGLFSSKKEPSWEVVATKWVGHCDGISVFYKLPEHLKGYWKTWEENATEKNSIKINHDTYDQIRRLLGVPSSITARPLLPAALPTSVQQQIPAARKPETTSNVPVDPWHVASLLTHHTTMQSAVQFGFGEAALEHSPRDGPSRGTKRQRPEEQTENQRLIKIAKRKPRTCGRCHRADCEGKFNSRPCKIEST